MTGASRLIDFLNGAVALGYLVAAAFFLKFRRRTGDRLFLAFAAAFLLLAANSAIVTTLGQDDERTGYAYILRIVGFLFILYAIIRKNTARAGG